MPPHAASQGVVAPHELSEGQNTINDPLRKIIQAGIIGLCFSNPATGARLSGLELQHRDDASRVFQIDGNTLIYNGERVKALTSAGLRDALLAVAEITH